MAKAASELDAKPRIADAARAVEELRSFSGGDAEVGDVVTFFQRRNGVDVEDDGGHRSARLGDDFADVGRDGAGLHSGGGVSAALDERITGSGAVGKDIGGVLNPGR